jgi:hypothetical protein
MCRIGFTTEYKVDTVDLVIWRQVNDFRARRRSLLHSLVESRRDRLDHMELLRAETYV